MGFSTKHVYSKDIAAVFQVFTSKDYLEQKFAALGAKNITILECAESKGKFVIKSQRDVPSNPPGFAKKFLKAFNTVIEEDLWEISDGQIRHGTFEVDIKGTPITLKGTMTLSASEEGCQNAISGAAKVSIPLIGGQIAKFVESDTEKNLKGDYEFTQKYLEQITHS